MKKLFTKIISTALVIFLFGFLSPSSLVAQEVGDYRSVASGNWSANSTWETYDGSAWNAATMAPGATNDVYIEESDEVTLDVSASVKNLNLDDDQSGPRLDLTSNTLEVSGIIRSFKGTRLGAADIDNGGPNATVIISTGGLLKFIGNTRDITTSGQWGGSPRNFDCEFALTTDEVGTLKSTFKAGNIIISSGILICNNDLRAELGNNTPGSADITVKDGATLRMTNNADIVRVGTGAANSYIGTLTVESGATLEFTKTVGFIGATVINFDGLVLYSSSSDPQTLVTKGPVTDGTDPSTYTDLTLQAGGAKTLGLNTTVNGILSMRTGNGAAPSLALGGFELNYGPSSRLQYRGIASGVAQTTGSAEWPDAGSGNSMPPLVDIFNQYDVTLNADKEITGQLKFSGGGGINAKLILETNNLSVGSINRVNPSDPATKYVVTSGTGSLTLPNIGSSDVLFPIGPSTSLYHPATINNSGTVDDFSVRVESAPGSCSDADQTVNADWNISEGTPGGSNCTLTLDFTGASVGNSFDSADAELVDCDNLAHNGSVTGTVATGSGFTSFSPFGITSDPGALPIELTYFRATPNQEEVLIQWQTAVELNNDYMVVERSTDGRTFSEIGRVRGQGNSTLLNNYEMVDKNPATGVNYYRIHQFDFDGTNEYSDIVQVTFRGEGSELQVYPTLVQHTDLIYVDLSDRNNSLTSFDIFDLNGRMISSTALQGGDVASVSVDHLQNGMYLIKERNSAINSSTRFIIAR